MRAHALENRSEVERDNAPELIARTRPSRTAASVFFEGTVLGLRGVLNAPRYGRQSAVSLKVRLHNGWQEFVDIFSRR